MGRIRPATFDDAQRIALIQGRNGMGQTDPLDWRNRWESYPFREVFRDVPIGWVLESDEGEPVGSLDNVQLLYEMEGRLFKAAIAAGWAVDSNYRGKSLRLMTSFLRQKGVDLLLNVSASPATAEILTALKIPRIPIPDYGRPCFWAIRPHAFAKAALERKSVRGRDALAWPAGVVLAARDFMRGSGRGELSSKVSRADTFDGRFDDLWGRLKAGPPRLRAVRTSAVLDWRFSSGIQRGRAILLVAGQPERPSGYAVLVRRSGGELNLDAFDVADIQAVQDDPVTLRDLLLGSIRAAREEGADALKFMSGTPAKRAAAEALRPYTYQLSFWQQYYKVISRDLDGALSTADKWDFSLFETY